LEQFVILIEELPKDAEYDGFLASENEDSITVDNSFFEVDLDSEEINILAILMMINWV